MLAMSMRPPTQNLILLSNGSTVIPDNQFKQEFSPVANFTTLKVNVSSAIQADVAFKIAYCCIIGNGTWAMTFGTEVVKKYAYILTIVARHNSIIPGPSKEMLSSVGLPAALTLIPTSLEYHYLQHKAKQPFSMDATTGPMGSMGLLGIKIPASTAPYRHKMHTVTFCEHNKLVNLSQMANRSGCPCIVRQSDKSYTGRRRF